MSPTGYRATFERDQIYRPEVRSRDITIDALGGGCPSPSCSTSPKHLPISHLRLPLVYSPSTTMSSSVSQQELHTPTNDPATLKIAPGLTLSDLQRRHVAVVLDLFQAKGTMAKIKDNFSQDAVYEDPFAKSGGIEELDTWCYSSPMSIPRPLVASVGSLPAGQLLNVPSVTSGTKTNHYQVTTVTPTSTNNAKGESVPVDEITVDFDHEITFKAPLPESAKTMHLQTTLHIFSDAKQGKIVRLMDHSAEELQESSLPNVRPQDRSLRANRSSSGN